MKFAEPIETEVLPVRSENIVRIPLGLLGFEPIKEYVLLIRPEETPFLWLQMLNDPNLAFLVVSPFVVHPSYEPDITAEDAEFLELKQPEDALVFNIVTVRPAGAATVNLRGPIVLNRHTLIAKQVIPTNAADFDLHHPLPTA
ncbi:MAG: flagellar assembly protein FliW [Verrucomicrobia bacterium]|nr:flagellar assembly protein FliW [Verrucomicrobiota bacterium]